MFECDCICHSDQSKKHCDELTCMPCCTICKHCENKIKLGKMLEHLSKDHGIEISESELNESKAKTLKFINDLIKEGS